MKNYNNQWPKTLILSMKSKHLRRLIIFGSFVLTGLMIVQIYWFRKAFDAREHEVDHRVQVALMRVADSVSTGAQVRQLSSNFYFVTTETQLNSDAIDRLVKTEFEKRNLLLDYELGVYNAEDDTLLYGQYVEATRKTLFEQKAISGKKDAALKNFAVYFPQKKTYLVAQLDVWIFSTAALLLMMCFFAWAIATLLRERKFAELKSDFINNMTHEFKTPVTNIGIATEILKKKLPEVAGLGVYLDILEKENEKLKNKIEKILLGATLDRKPSLERIDIHQIITDCAASFQLKVRERDGTLQLRLDAENRIILGDRELLSQAINNVIDNAEKYSPGRPYIVVSTSDNNRAIDIDIRDKGMGVPDDLHSKVFEKFFRAQNGNIHNVKGFGLGLNYVRRVIQSHRGKVSLFSKMNAGTDVKITLPSV